MAGYVLALLSSDASLVEAEICGLGAKSARSERTRKSRKPLL